jgi:protein-disulfide isomerase
MSNNTVDIRALESLQLGSGPLNLDVFLEATCPYSKRAFDKLQPLLAAVGKDRLTVNIRFVSQPWHLFSAIVTRCILAAAATSGGTQAGLKVLNHVFENREEFVCEDHCSGPNLTRSPADLIAHITELSKVDFADAFVQDGVTTAVKWHVRYARQNGVHSSPSFAVNGLLNDAMDSGQSIEEWAELLGLDIAA